MKITCSGAEWPTLSKLSKLGVTIQMDGSNADPKAKTKPREREPIKEQRLTSASAVAHYAWAAAE